MTASTKQRRSSAYRQAMEALDGMESSFVDTQLDAIEDYVEWLGSQITTKRKTIQALNAELDELR